MSATEIKNEIQKLKPAEKREIFRWVSEQLHVADLVQRNWRLSGIVESVRD